MSLKWVSRILFFILFAYFIAQGRMMTWLAIYGITLLLAPFFGRIYCGYICPMATVMEPVDRYANKWKWQTDRIPKWLGSGWFAWVMFIASIAFMLYAQRVLKIGLPLLLVWLVVSILITLRYKQEVFHNLICPFSPLQRLFGRPPVLSERVDANACIGCRRCEKACPSAAIAVQDATKKAVIHNPLCFQCKACEKVCPTDAIAYGRPSSSFEA